MFVSIKLINNKPDFEHNVYHMEYLLKDTDFIINIKGQIDMNLYDTRADASIIPSGLIVSYEKYKKNIPKNLALFYHSTSGNFPEKTQEYLIATDCKWTDDHFPAIGFGEKYYQCLLNQMKVLRFTGRTKYA